VKVLILTSTPNANGLTAACGEAARQGVVDSRSRARLVNLNELGIARCAVCNDGWGTCRTKHHCQVADDFQDLHRTAGEAEGYVLVSPVYFGEPSEPFKAFLDRLRRCEATRGNAGGERSALSGKPAVCVAAAGGSGHGTLECLAMMERALRSVGVDVVDVIPVTRRTRDYQLESIHDALVAMTTPSPGTAGGEQSQSAAPTGSRPSRRRRRR